MDTNELDFHAWWTVNGGASFKTLSGPLWIVIRSGEGQSQREEPSESGLLGVKKTPNTPVVLAAGGRGGRRGCLGLSLLGWARQGPSKVSVNYLAFQGSLKFNARLLLFSVDPTLELGGAGKAGAGSRFLAPCWGDQASMFAWFRGLTVPVSEVPEKKIEDDQSA